MDDVDWDNLPPSTAPVGLAVSVQGFTNHDAAIALGKVVGETVMTLGSFMDLSTLAGVTIGIDYDAALASIDQGMEGLRPLDRTDTEEMQGVAKTCQVVRDGEVKSHLAFNAAMIVSLIAEDETTIEDRQTAIGIIAHECAHVDVNARMQALVPDARLGVRIRDIERAVLFQIAEIAWEEYAVCRLSAQFAPRQNEQHSDTVRAVLPDARKRANEHIKTYRIHANLSRLIGEAGFELCQPIKAAAYLLGGMDADNLTWEDFPAARATIEASGYGNFIDELHERCRTLWDSQDKWSADVDVLAPLVDLTRNVFESGGIYFQKNSDGEWYISVPFTSETMPDEATVVRLAGSEGAENA